MKCCNCNKQIPADSEFCQYCGHTIMTESAKDSRSSYSSKAEQEAVLADVAAEIKAGKYKEKKSPLVFIIPIIVIFAIIGLVFVIVQIHNATSLIITKDNNTVFRYKPEEYLKRFNEANSDNINEPYDYSDFVKTTTSEGKAQLISNQTPEIIIFLAESNYDSNIQDIKYATKGQDIAEYITIDSKYDAIEENEVPDMVAYEFKALFPNLSTQEAKKIISEYATPHPVAYHEQSSVKTYNGVYIIYLYSEEMQHWFISSVPHF